MIKRTTKKSVYSAILFASVFLISTAFMSNTNTMANAQEYDYDADSYVYDIEKMDREKTSSSTFENDYYKQDNKKDKKSPVVTIKKELFVCDEAQTEEEFFYCDDNNGFSFISSQNSGRYVECTEDLCPGIDESTFSAFIHKNVALIEDLNSEGKKVNLNKFHYTVAEDQIDERNKLGQGEGPFSQFLCQASGFDDGLEYRILLKSVISEDQIAEYGICIVYEGDCQGIIHAGEEKTCTIKNYIFTNAIDS